MLESKWMLHVSNLIKKENAVEIYRILEEYDELQPCCAGNSKCEFRMLRDKFYELFLEFKQDPAKMIFFKLRLKIARVRERLIGYFKNIPKIRTISLKQYELDIIERLKDERNVQSGS